MVFREASSVHINIPLGVLLDGEKLLFLTLAEKDFVMGGD